MCALLIDCIVFCRSKYNLLLRKSEKVAKVKFTVLDWRHLLAFSWVVVFGACLHGRYLG